MFKRRRFKQQLTLHDRLAAWAKQVQEQAASLPPGAEREALIKKARQADVANHLDDWAKSPGLQSPK
jgi:leucyl aminopeptidase